jgi:chorismate mutase
MSVAMHIENEGPVELQRLRDSIDNLDAVLVHTLAERFKCTQQVGALKARARLPAADPVREAAQIRRLRVLAETARLDPEFADTFRGVIVKEVIRNHEAVRGQATRPAAEATGV